MADERAPTQPSECPNRPEWAAPVPAISPEGFCFHCSKAKGEWAECAATQNATAE